MKVMLVVTHLLGTGHLTRALTLARAFDAAGHSVHLVTGGAWPPHLKAPAFDVVQLPPVGSDGVDFTSLLSADGTVATPHLMAKRQQLLIETLEKLRPDALITELFPFGRRILKNEFLALLSAAKALPIPPRIFASIRDILAPPSKPAKATFAQDTLGRFYDAVLVHAAASVTPLSLSWPVSPDIETRLRYTGFVASPPPPPHPEQMGSGEILVTAGGGEVGAALFETAKQAALRDKSRKWRCLIGGQNATQTCAQMQSDAPANFAAEPARPDFRKMLHHAAASVSFCGYNTALDLLQTTCPCVFVPFDAGGEVEQGIRAQALAKQSGIELVWSADMTAETLLAAIDAAMSTPRIPIDDTQTHGAHQTVKIVAELCEAGG